MKIQIRKNCFETNSSTMHTLTICNKNTDLYYKDYIGKTISIPVDDYIDYDKRWKNMNKTNPIYKLCELWNSTIGYDCNIGDFIHRIDFIKSALSKFGINFEVSMNEDDYRKCEYEGEELFILHELFGVKDNIDDEIKLMNFIFNPESWHDSYEDSYGECPYENEILKDNETIWERDG